MADAANDLDSFLDDIDENGVHLCQLEQIRYQAGKDGRNWVVFRFVVTDPESPLEGEQYERWVRDFSHLTPDDYQSLTGKEKSEVRRSRKSLTEMLLSVGFSEDQAKEIRNNPKSEIRKEANGTQVRVEVSVSESANKVFKNIVKVTQVVPDDGNPLNPPF